VPVIADTWPHSNIEEAEEMEDRGNENESERSFFFL
jgi:hypothetical protein